VKLRALSELQAFKMQLDHARREAAEREARERAEAQRLQRERRLFADAVGPVQPLKDRGLADIRRPRPAPLPKQRALDERSVLREALSDEMDVESLLETDEALSFRRPGVGPEVPRRLRRGEWTIQAQVDLHGLRRDEARERLAEFIREAARQGLRCVRVVHGKGHGSPGKSPVLKGKVRAWLVQKSEVMAFTQARASEGGAGALVVLLGSGH
jgi:DNA-nicking Smr family endonuclease